MRLRGCAASPSDGRAASPATDPGASGPGRPAATAALQPGNRKDPDRRSCCPVRAHPRSGSGAAVPGHPARGPRARWQRQRLLRAADVAVPGLRAAGHRSGRLRSAGPCRTWPCAGLCPAGPRPGRRRRTAEGPAAPPDCAFGGPGRRGAAALARPSGSPTTARGAAGTATSTTTSRPSTRTGPRRSATTATPTCTRASWSRDVLRRPGASLRSSRW